MNVSLLRRYASNRQQNWKINMKASREPASVALFCTPMPQYAVRRRSVAHGEKRGYSKESENAADGSPFIGTVDVLQTWQREAHANPWILRGHRINHQSVRAALGSLFTLHNQTVNIYTHGLAAAAFLVALGYTVAFDPLFEHHLSPTDKVLVLLFFLSAIAVFVNSTSFHIFSCVSPRAHKVFATLDYSSVVFHVGIIILGCLHFGFFCLGSWWYLYIGVNGAIFAILIPVVTFSPNLALRRFSLFAWGCSGFIPLGHYALALGVDHPEVLHLAPRVALSMCGYVLAFFPYVTKWPEKKYPGTFDYFFASHQLWHILGISSSLYQIVLMQDALYYRKVLHPCERW